MQIKPIMENHVEKKMMYNEMEAGIIKVLYADPSRQTIPTLGPKACKDFLHWAIWISRVQGLRTEHKHAWGSGIRVCKLRGLFWGGTTCQHMTLLPCKDRECQVNTK